MSNVHYREQRKFWRKLVNKMKVYNNKTFSFKDNYYNPGFWDCNNYQVHIDIFGFEIKFKFTTTKYCEDDDVTEVTEEILNIREIDYILLLMINEDLCSSNTYLEKDYVSLLKIVVRIAEKINCKSEYYNYSLKMARERIEEIHLRIKKHNEYLRTRQQSSKCLTIFNVCDDCSSSYDNYSLEKDSFSLYSTNLCFGKYFNQMIDGELPKSICF